MSTAALLRLALLVAAGVGGASLLQLHDTETLAEDPQWSEYVRGDRLRLPDHVASSITKRSSEMASGKTFGTLSKRCEAPGQRKGRCTHWRYCKMDEFKANSTLMLDYLCVIKHTFVGVCCPETDKPSGGLLGSGILPAILSNVLQHQTTTSTTRAPHRPGAGSATLRPTRKPTGDSTPSQDRGCGVSSLKASRIVGGQPADLKEWPWMVALIRLPDVQYCGGVLITDRHVLTAAHCIQPLQLREIRVRLGEYDLSTTSESPSREFPLEEARIHQDYSSGTYENDIAILKMRRPTAFNNYIWPVCLPPPGGAYAGKEAVVIGWGTVSFGGPASITLMEVEVPVWNLTHCKTKFTQPIFETFLCAGAYEGGKDSCQGDSGGPLLLQLDNGRWVTIGVVSWGIRCGEPSRPGVYTRVDAYLEWITDNAVF